MTLPVNIDGQASGLLSCTPVLEENYRAGMEAGGYFHSCRLFKKILARAI